MLKKFTSSDWISSGNYFMFLLYCYLFKNICFFYQVATRVAYGTGLAKLGKNNSRVIALDGDTKNSTYSIKLKVRHSKVTQVFLCWHMMNYKIVAFIHLFRIFL